MELFLDLSDCTSHFYLCQPEQDGEKTQQGDCGWSEDGEMQGCGRLERRWVLWHEFMKEHAHLDTWLRLAEKAVNSSNSAPITYITAKEQLRKFERLRCEAGSLVIRLDGLTRRNRTLTQLFQGSMRARLLSSSRECGQRWDNVNAKLDCITGQLKLFVSEWDGFDAQREELALWLTDLDIRLTEVDQLTGNTCEKLRQLQSFQRCVCENSARVNALLQRGEVLIQQSDPTDAQCVEKRLMELLRGCSNAYNKIARTHTRLLSMRLVFEDDLILSQATDSGCPSESLLEEEGGPDKDFPPDVKANPNSLDLPSAHLPLPPPSCSSPTHEHLGLEWDPSVDIGRSVSHDDSDSSYFSVSTGLCHRDGLKRRSYLSSLGSYSDINNDLTNQQAADLHLEGLLDHDPPNVFSPVAARGGRMNGGECVTSTPGRQDIEPLGFDGGRVRAWLGVHSPAPPVRRSSCSKAVQTDGEAEVEEEQSCFDEAEHCFSEISVNSSSIDSAPFHLCSPAFFYFLLAAGLVFLAYLLWVILEPPCHHSNRMPRSFHLALRYVNGPRRPEDHS